MVTTLSKELDQELYILTHYFKKENQKIFFKYNIFVHKTYCPNDTCQLVVNFITVYKVTSRDITTDTALSLLQNLM